MTLRGIRGATTAGADDKQEVLAATRELLKAILASNPDLEAGDIASVIFTVTEDLVSAFPAQAARDLGWTLVPMMCSREIPVPASLSHAIRVLIHWNTEKAQSEIKHVYLREAVKLRPDLAASKEI